MYNLPKHAQDEDDFLVTGHVDMVEKRFIPALKGSYKISYSILRDGWGAYLSETSTRFAKWWVDVDQISSQAYCSTEGNCGYTPKGVSQENSFTSCHWRWGQQCIAEWYRDVKVSKCSRHIAVFGSRFTTLPALHSFSGNQDDVSNPALLASVETCGVLFSGKSRFLLEPQFQGSTERSVSWLHFGWTWHGRSVYGCRLGIIKEWQEKHQFMCNLLWRHAFHSQQNWDSRSFEYDWMHAKGILLRRLWCSFNSWHFRDPWSTLTTTGHH